MKTLNSPFLLITIALSCLVFGCNSGTLDEREFRLVRASVAGDIKKVQELLARGVDPNTVDSGVPLLMAVALKGNYEIAKLLIDAGAQVNARNSWGQTALMWASAEGHERMVDILIDGGAEVDAKDNLGQTALFDAIKAGHVEIVRRLVEAGATENIKDEMGQTPLTKARDGKQDEILRILIEAGTRK